MPTGAVSSLVVASVADERHAAGLPARVGSRLPSVHGLRHAGARHSGHVRTAVVSERGGRGSVVFDAIAIGADRAAGKPGWFMGVFLGAPVSYVSVRLGGLAGLGGLLLVALAGYRAPPAADPGAGASCHGWRLPLHRG
jgi:hypothetical protein